MVGTAHPSTPLRGELRLMPLPHSSYGPAASSLTAEADSGWVTNTQAADDDLDPSMTAAKLARLDRITGYRVDFDDLTKVSHQGLLIGAESDVDLFRTKAGDARYVARQASDFRRFEGKLTSNGYITDRVSYFAVPGVRGARGIRAHFHAGAFTLWETAAVFPVGVLAASVALDRSDRRDVRAEVRRLALALRQRIRGVLAGKVHDKPLTQHFAKLGRRGPPPGGPELSRMAISPIDFDVRVKPTRQGYVRDPDDVAKYVREFKSVTFGSSALSSLKAEVELGPNTKSAQNFLAVMRAIFHGPTGKKFLRRVMVSSVPQRLRPNFRWTSVSLTKFAAGDEALAYTARARVFNVRIQLAFCAVRRGPVVESLTLVSEANERIPRLDIVRAARTAAARIDLDLSR